MCLSVQLVHVQWLLCTPMHKHIFPCIHTHTHSLESLISPPLAAQPSNTSNKPPPIPKRSPQNHVDPALVYSTISPTGSKHPLLKAVSPDLPPTPSPTYVDQSQLTSPSPTPSDNGNYPLVILVYIVILCVVCLTEALRMCPKYTG